MDHLTTPYGEITLERYPPRQDDPLRAYDAADGYLLDEVAERHPEARSVLVVGDRHGALTTALAGTAEVTMWADSALSRQATAANLATNGVTADIVDSLPSRDFDLVLVRPGKARALLAEQLHHAGDAVREGTPVVLGEMVKHLGRWMTDVLEDHIGPTSASLAHRKARLLRAERDSKYAEAPAWTSYEGPQGIELHNAPGTFAASGVDAGSQLLLQSLPDDLGSARVADLGCGNGVLAIGSALRNPDASYLLVDESAAAVASAARSWEANLPGRPVDIVHGDGLHDAPEASLDVVLCNPPFHAGTTVDEWIGQRLLEQAHRALRPGGSLYVVANRHLNHHRYLRHAFDTVEVLASNPKFSVLRAVR